MTAPMMPQQPPQPLQPPTPPWTPFAALPMDSEPEIAKVRKRRLSRLMATARFSSQPKEWQAVVVQAYLEARQALAAAAQAQTQAQGVSGTNAKPPSTPQTAPSRPDPVAG